MTPRFVTTAGVGLLDRPFTPSASGVRPGDAVLVSGPIGDHGTTVMLARGELKLSADVRSDTAPLHGIAADVAVVLDERAVPVRPAVTGAAVLLGIDPLYVACEGRMLAVVAPDRADAALARSPRTRSATARP